MARFEPDPDLDVKVAAAFLRPEVQATARAVAAYVKVNGPIDTGLLRLLVGTDPVDVAGTQVRALVHSSRPSDDGRHDVAAYVEFGTRYMTPRRYMARAARAVVRARGTGRFVEATSPWPHR